MLRRCCGFRDVLMCLGRVVVLICFMFSRTFLGFLSCLGSVSLVFDAILHGLC